MNLSYSSSINYMSILIVANKTNGIINLECSIVHLQGWGSIKHHQKGEIATNLVQKWSFYPIFGLFIRNFVLNRNSGP